MDAAAVEVTALMTYNSIHVSLTLAQHITTDDSLQLTTADIHPYRFLKLCNNNVWPEGWSRDVLREATAVSTPCLELGVRIGRHLRGPLGG